MTATKKPVRKKLSTQMRAHVALARDAWLNASTPEAQAKLRDEARNTLTFLESLIPEVEALENHLTAMERGRAEIRRRTESIVGLLKHLINEETKTATTVREDP